MTAVLHFFHDLIYGFVKGCKILTIGGFFLLLSAKEEIIQIQNHNAYLDKGKAALRLEYIKYITILLITLSINITVLFLIAKTLFEI